MRASGSSPCGSKPGSTPTDMGASKDFFQRNKDLAAWWSAVAKNAEFEQVIMAVRSELMDKRMSAEGTMGAQEFENTLRTLSDSYVESPLARIKSGLSHDIDDPKSERPPTDAPTQTGTTQLGT